MPGNLTIGLKSAFSTTGSVDLFASVGNTPLLELTTLSKLTGCKLLAKAEYANPSGSIKDRVAKSLILDAEERGLLKPGGTIIEATGGSTGVSLALLGFSWLQDAVDHAGHHCEGEGADDEDHGS
ncbi:hypothetical protein KRP22_013079 [Phytophthora ramorum]|nr:Cysteine synthase [Phytophthora ramorum]